MPSGAGALAVLEGFLEQEVMWLIHLYWAKHEARVRSVQVEFKSCLPVYIWIRHTLSGLYVPFVQWGGGTRWSFLTSLPSLELTSSQHQCLLNIFPFGKPDV